MLRAAAHLRRSCSRSCISGSNNIGTSISPSLRLRSISSSSKDQKVNETDQHTAATLPSNEQLPLWGYARGIAGTGATVNDMSRLELTSTSGVFFPRNDADIALLLANAYTNNATISIRGAAHSMGAQSIPNSATHSSSTLATSSDCNGWQLDMRFFNRVHYDATTTHVTVQSGAMWSDVIRILNYNARAPLVMQSYCSFSVGGTVSVNAHGVSSDSSMVDAIESLYIMRVCPETHRPQRLLCSRTVNSDLFSGVCGGYGLFGIITDITLRTVANAAINMEVLQMDRDTFVPSYQSLCNDTDIEVKIVRIHTTELSKATAYVFRRASNVAVVSKLNYRPPPMKRLSAVLLTCIDCFSHHMSVDYSVWIVYQ
jgi:FAD/FMN-containing dehydrogenase